MNKVVEQAKKEKEEFMISIMKEEMVLEIKVEEILEEKDMATSLIKEEIIISYHTTKEKAEIVLNLPIEEEEKVIIINEDLIVFTVGGLDTKLQIVDSYIRITTTLKQMLQRINTRILVRILTI